MNWRCGKRWAVLGHRLGSCEWDQKHVNLQLFPGAGQVRLCPWPSTPNDSDCIHASCPEQLCGVTFSTPMYILQLDQSCSPQSLGKASILLVLFLFHITDTKFYLFYCRFFFLIERHVQTTTLLWCKKFIFFMNINLESVGIIPYMSQRVSSIYRLNIFG